MKIELKEILVKDLVDGYINNYDEEGVLGFGGKLNIRPKYQREFVYTGKQRDEVINTVRNNFPLNTIYWAVNSDGTYEVLDGQQRTISICEYVAGSFALNHKYYHNLEKEEQDQILGYKLMVYFCEGTSLEKLNWFRVINIGGEKLEDQELRNAVYAGPWLTHAKRYFSKSNCAAQDLAGNYIRGKVNRQKYLEKAISWISGGNIEQYMADNQHKPDAKELWLYFLGVINWVKVTFPKYRKEMKGVKWGPLYNEFRDIETNSNLIEEEIAKLMMDEDVTKKAGIYEYLFRRDEKYLSIRSFSNNQKREAYEKQEGICPVCGKHFEIDEMEADHITPWCEGGKTITENCQMLCKHCNRVKSNK